MEKMMLMYLNLRIFIFLSFVYPLISVKTLFSLNPVATVPSGTLLIRNTDAKDNMINFELRNGGIKGILRYLPVFRPKPIAKAGIRNYVASTSVMDAKISSLYSDDGEKIEVALLVYMWVTPSFRGKAIGDVLLNQIYLDCVDKNRKYILLVHDDDGSGKLKKFYSDRGFYDVSDVVPKGMLAKIEMPSA